MWHHLQDGERVLHAEGQGPGALPQAGETLGPLAWSPEVLLPVRGAHVARVSPQDEQKIKPQYFTFRWLTLLLSQEFLLPDVIRIWDTLFSDQERFHFLLLVCCAMLM